MLVTTDFIRGIADYAESVLGPALASAFAGALQDYPGMSAAAVSALTLLVVYGGLRLLRLAVTPEPEPDWERIDAGDPRAVAAAFDNLHILATLARRLGLEVADTEVDFRAQLIAYQRRLMTEKELRDAQKAALKASRR